jgi:hypothetical protein
MIDTNRKNGSDPVALADEAREIETGIRGGEKPVGASAGTELATRARLRARQQFQQNRLVIIGAGALVVALLLFVAVSMPRKPMVQKSKAGATGQTQNPATEAPASSDKSLFPIMDSGRPAAPAGRDGFLNERDLERTAKPRPTVNMTPPTNTTGTLGAIPPFGDQQNWQAPPYQPGANVPAANETSDTSKAEREATEKSSLVYVRSTSSQTNSRAEESMGSVSEPGLGLATGTRLRARLESAASSAVRTPVVAVIEYNYERDGDIVVPAGTKAIGHMQDADRSGYARVQFDSLQMPDGATIPMQAVATDLEMRPLRGKVEGKNNGKNVLVRSLSGIGQAGTLLVGRGGLNQPLSEGDLLRERVSNNIGEASDEQVSRIAVTQRIVVTIPANTAIYVVLEQGPHVNGSPGQATARAGQAPAVLSDTQELRQLLQLQRELNQSITASK